MRAGITFRGINVENDFICDGHHRYIASLLADYSIERLPTNRTAATIITCWESVVFEEDEWDTTAEIDKFNQQDADDNNMPIEKVIEILK